MDTKLAYIIAILGAACWGLIGLFVQFLYDFGFTAWDVVAIRAIFSAVLLLLYVSLFKRELLKIQLKHLPLFIGSGIISIVFFNWCLFTVMDQANISLAVVLLYTGPLFVTILSRIFFKESLTIRKGLAIFITLTGCAFVVGLLPSIDTVITASTLLIGVGSGFFYALYSIFAKVSSRHYGSLTITTYSFICASVFMASSSQLYQKVHLLFHWDVLIFSLGLALVPTIVAYLLYTKGLQYIESSRASILSTIEPVVAIGIGFLFFQDILTFWQWMGVFLVLSSIILAAETSQKKDKKKTAVAQA
ncbi:DMT family transporter [Halalkalibacter okhensis]|uniref:Transporter n=1 Tax=Halalkalibacter okhensis TaxID=333138 RepID=A0A0B0IGN1_9BACI|nr:EamA family transporter [Halalkalibacter okhensis]KHF40440.1 transporter [Halalkalibacter okhensis]